MCTGLELAAGSQGLGTILDAGSAFAASKGRKQSLAYQAGVAARNAGFAKARGEDILERGKEAEFKHGRAIRSIKGEQKAQIAASGADVSFGSALDILASTEIIGQHDIGTIRQNTKRAKFSADIDEFNATARGNLLQAASDSENPMLTAGLSLLGGAAKFGSKLSGSGRGLNLFSRSA